MRDAWLTFSSVIRLGVMTRTHSHPPGLFGALFRRGGVSDSLDSGESNLHPILGCLDVPGPRQVCSGLGCCGTGFRALPTPLTPQSPQLLLDSKAPARPFLASSILRLSPMSLALWFVVKSCGMGWVPCTGDGVVTVALARFGGSRLKFLWS